jgi:hypothetical protein
MSAETVAQTQRENNTSLLKNMGILLVIASTLLAGVSWVFNVNAKAESAAEASRANAVKIEQKADKEDVKDGFRSLNEKFDHLQDYLMRERQRRGN